MKKFLPFLFVIIINQIITADVNAQRSQGIPCLENTFWGIGLFSPILQYTMINGDSVIITGSDSAIYGVNYPASLAYCNNLNGGALNPTFYSSYGDFTDPKTILYQDTGNKWVAIPQASPHGASNCGGNGNYLYFLDNGDTLPNYIYRYDGSHFTDVFIDSLHYITVADLSVDDNGNIYFFSGDSTFNASDPFGPLPSKWLTVISPAGKILKQYNFPIADATDHDGSFLMNGILYMHYSTHGGYYNYLLPIEFTPDSAIAQPVINMPYTQYIRADFAGCNAGVPTAIVNVLPPPPLSVKVFPNPAGNTVYISSEQFATYTVYDLMGQAIYANDSKEKMISLNISAYPDGLYLLIARTGENQQTVEKFIVQH